MMLLKRFLTIAGSDCSGGAGIQADMRVAVRHGWFPMSVVTALTAQTRRSVRSTLLTPPEFVAEQLDAVFDDSTPDAIKIGMLGSREIVEVVARKLFEYNAKNIVLDTVFISSSGYELLDKNAVAALKEKLIPLCDVITPNIPEAEILAGMKVNSMADMEKCAIEISIFFPKGIIITGGHLKDGCNDLLFANGEFTWAYGEKINSGNTHGTGCAFSSSLACNLSEGKSLESSLKSAKEYVAEQIRSE